MRVITVLLLFVLVGAGGAHAQRRLVSIEANPIAGTVAYGWARSPTTFYGIELGFGFPQVDRTLAPDSGSFLDFAHVGVFLRMHASDHVAFDTRLQLGLAELNGCSGCLPGAFGGVSGAIFVGGRRFKVGPRITAGAIREGSNPSEFVLNLTPVAVLFTHTW